MNLLGTRSTRNRDLARPPAVIKGRGWLILCCDSIDLELAADPGNQPWCDHFLKPRRARKGALPSVALHIL